MDFSYDSIEYDYSKLKGRITEKFGTQSEFLKAITMSEPTLIKKLNGKSKFCQSEMEMFCEVLNINTDEIPIYFFTRKVRKNLI